MSQPRHFNTYTSARQHFRAVLDAARAGLVTTVARCRALCRRARRAGSGGPCKASAFERASRRGGWRLGSRPPGLPIHGDGETFDAALDDVIVALREYAEDWNDRLRLVPNHAQNRAVAELVELSTDDQLRDWLLGGAMSASARAGGPNLLPA